MAARLVQLLISDDPKDRIAGGIIVVMMIVIIVLGILLANWLQGKGW